MSVTKTQLQWAHKIGQWMLKKDTEFYIRRLSDDRLVRPAVVLKSGTVVEVIKLYRKGEAALLKYTDKSGKIWWSWTHCIP